MGERERNRCRERIEALARAGLDPEQARRAAITEIRRAVGFGRWCWPLLDPDSSLAMNGIAEFDLWPSLPRLVALEEQDDIASKPRLRMDAPASVALSAATAGDVATNRRWRECLHPYDIGDELLTACRDRHGCWGSVELMRDSDDKKFSDDDIRLLNQLAPTLGALVRRSLVQSWRANGGDAGPLPPGTLILDRNLSPTGWTSPVRDWLADLAMPGDMLPPAVYQIGARILMRPEAASGLPVRVRIRTQSGRWLIIEGAPMEGGEADRVAITFRAATADEVFDLLCKAHDLTQRERQLATLLRGGLATKQLSEALHISPYTVQDHLKAIFEKAGVRSRGELLSHLTDASRG